MPVFSPVINMFSFWIMCSCVKFEANRNNEVKLHLVGSSVWNFKPVKTKEIFWVTICFTGCPSISLFIKSGIWYRIIGVAKFLPKKTLLPFLLVFSAVNNMFSFWIMCSYVKFEANKNNEVKLYLVGSTVWNFKPIKRKEIFWATICFTTSASVSLFIRSSIWYNIVRAGKFFGTKLSKWLKRGHFWFPSLKLVVWLKTSGLTHIQEL